MAQLYKLLEEHAHSLLNNLSESSYKKIFNLSIAHQALLFNFYQKPFISIEESPENALNLFKDYTFFQNVINKRIYNPIIYFPPPSNLENIGLRCKALYEILSNKNINLVTSYDAISTGFNMHGINEQILHLKKGVSIERDNLKQMLENLGYKEVSLVVEKGDFAQRGWLFDIYPVTEEYPVRVEFFGDDIEILKLFDLESQRSIKEIQEIKIFSAAEDELTNNLIDELTRLHEFDVFCETAVYQDLISGLNKDNIKIISVSHLPFTGDGIDSGEQSLKGLGIVREERKTFDEILSTLTNIDKIIVIVLPSEAQAQRMKDICLEGNLIIPLIDRSSLCQYEGKKCIITGSLSSGINLPRFLILSDKEIFGESPPYKIYKKSKLSNLLASIDDLKKGDFVVHDDHGIGKFIGLQRQTIEGYDEELVIIEYYGGDRLYVPSYNIQKVKKFSASDGHLPALNRLGSKRWEKTKQKVKQGIRDMAEKLLRLYAERKVSKGFIFSDDTPLHREFDEFFPYEETDDQIKAFKAIKNLMTSDLPMDMLLCGDVGFGKTEVAIKAAFRAVYDGKQVAVIVPTTLLAEQHYRTFTSRFSPFPVKIAYLSRFKSEREIKESLIAISKGEIDIIIGTHIILKKDIKFSDLGLLIIDEEHRFGVSQKERLKELRSGIDVLTLTATPIPRTLHLSLSGIRDMFTIQTPPEERVAVKTFITSFNEKTIKEAIEREHKRGGQTFFVHNRIGDINKIADFLRNLLPNLNIDIAHGRMTEIEIEKVMLRFLNNQIDVLVCTAIIGSGLDIPNANTLIVDRADTFGLSDLYQLKGRVGRAAKQAYAYFLIPGEEIITKDAKKRLQALQEMSYLGAGLRLALKDLEIRGAGNILGKEQSGHIHKVGFDTYLEMLEKTVADLKGESVSKEIESQIKFRLSAFIPEDYIPDISLRLSIYRRISMANSFEALIELRDEITDRFGSLPSSVNNLLQVMIIKLYAKRLYITKILDTGARVRFFFLIDQNNEYNIPEGFFDKILKNLFFLASDNKGIRFHPDGFEINIMDKDPDKAPMAVKEILSRLIDMQNKN